MSSDTPPTEAAVPSLASRITSDEDTVPPPPTITSATEPTATEPTATEPTATEPTVTEPTTTEPTTTETLPPDQVDGAPHKMNGSGLAEPEYEVEVKLDDLQGDPNNPLFSIKTFDELGVSDQILKGLSAMSFRKPSKIQEKALPLLFHNPPKNLIGQSQSGTGKTAAFVLNILARVDLRTRQPQALVLAPSRELARQILGVVTLMGEYLEGLQVVAAIPDPSRRGRIEGQVIVGTPGTVQDLIKKRQLDTSGMKVLVLDEADNMLDQQGLGDQCRRVKSMLRQEIQTVLFSATFPDQVLQFARAFAPNANSITLKQDELTVVGIKQFYFDCDSEESKYTHLVQFYGLLAINSSIIFCKRRDTAIEIENRMTADGHQVAHLSGALEGADRDAVIDRFRNGNAKVLITTNVLARGIDVSSVTMVVNYDVPELRAGVADPESYLHRIGRTGRFGRVGVAISFISDKRGWQMLRDISEHFGVSIEPLPTNDWDAVEAKVKSVIKSGRAGKSTAQMQGNAMLLDGAVA